MADELIKQLCAVVGPDAVLKDQDELLVYECDGLPQHKYRPRAVVFPETTEATAEVMRTLARHEVPYTPRGAGTGLSGGALALNHGVVIELGRMKKILRIDPDARTAVVQTGVVNLNVSRAVEQFGLYYIPDPSSQPTCTIGGNIAENAGGIHCLKYGTTTDHVLSALVVLSDGQIVELASAEKGVAGYDLLGVFIGSEGTFGIATEATLRLTPRPPAIRTLLADFVEVDDASQAVSAIIAAGVMPAALEMMDGEIIKAIEASIFAAGLPTDAGAALLIELDGIEAGIDDEAELVMNICKRYGARSCRLARDENERKKLWAARKGAFGAIGRIAPDSMIQDTVVPRSRLPEVLRESYSIAAKYGLILANVFHAGDGNLHPFICFDSRSPDQVLRVKEAGRELMEVCVRAGGSITGEHGVGLDKRDYLPLIFSADDMETMLSVRSAFDPLGLCNPGKIIPMLRGCGEARAVTTIGGNGDVAGSVIDDSRAFNSRENELPRAVEINSRYAERRGPASADLVQLHSSLTAIVGESNATSSPRLKDSPLASNGARDSIVNITPASVSDVAEVLKLSSEEGWKVVPAGAATWIQTGNPVAHDLVLSTTRMDQLMEHEPADLVATASAGVTLQNLNAALAQRGQWLPLDPPDDGRATIGGVVATGMSGAQAYGYGPPRRSVIGMKVVLADGRIIKAGGRVVKNVAGYDLCKLFAGSYGTLGVITEITFKLRPLPQATRTLSVHGSIEALLKSGQLIMTSQLFPVAVELLSGPLALQTGLSVHSEGVLLIRFAGSPRGVVEQSAKARSTLKDVDCEETSEDHTLWQTVAGLVLRTPDRTCWRVDLPAPSLSEWLRNKMRMRSGSPVESSMWQASVGSGRVRVIDQNEDNNTLVDRLRRLRGEAELLSGSLVLENASPEIKQQFDSWGGFGASGVLMKRIKERLDPSNILSPGRFG